ncbi:MAG: hypothetical protein JXB49_25405 [Bacteroidales bacterium]|nr:hypothetical protein [Bacteroidales bacterium]
MYINKIKDCIIQNAPAEIISQSREGYLYFKGHKLLTDFLVDLFNSFYSKHLHLNGEKTVLNLNSRILRKKYYSYKPYLDFLIQNKYISKNRNHIAGVRSTEYILNSRKLRYEEVIEYKNYDRSKNRRLLKFYNEPKNFISNGTKIDKAILHQIIENLRRVDIDYYGAFDCLQKSHNREEHIKYLKNLDSIKRIRDNQIYISPDKYGRIHTNFTVLKKEIRNGYLKIDGQPIAEIDIKNSQPFFLLKLIQEYLHIIYVNLDELSNYFNLVTKGLFYEYLQSNTQEQDRGNIKKQVYLEIFNKPFYESKLLVKSFPSIANFIKVFKLKNGYKTLAHRLQNIESDFIFNRVSKHLIDQKIVFFTVHDSICVKKSDYDKAMEIFDKEFSHYIAEVHSAIFNI